MYCNQPYINTGTAINTGQCFGYNPFNPAPTSGIHPDSVVGEGVVNHITLPDGTCQYFFTPANWWPPANPHYNVNTNQNPQWNSNIGTWFVRSISIPTQPQSWSNSPFQRRETPRPLHSSEYNMNVVPNGYQLKFHDDRWTSTTDLHYFCPRVRQIEHTFAFPSRGCAAVQVNTPEMTNTVCSYEVVNSKPCNCAATRHFVDTPVSAMSLDIESNTADCKNSSSFKNKLKKDSSDKCNSRLQLLPRDVRKKRVRFRKKTKNLIKKSICECHQPLLNKSISKDMNIDCCCPSPTINKSTTTVMNHSKNVGCEFMASVTDITAKANKNDKNESKSKAMYECGSPLIISKSSDINCDSCQPKTTATAKTQYSKDVGSECCLSKSGSTTDHVESKATECHLDKKESKSDVTCECNPPLIIKSKSNIDSDGYPSASGKESRGQVSDDSDHTESKASDSENAQEVTSFVDECLKRIELWYPRADDSKKYFQCCKKPSEACCSRQFRGK